MTEDTTWADLTLEQLIVGLENQNAIIAEIVRRASRAARYEKALDDAFLALSYRPENDQVRTIIGKALQ